MDNVKLFNRSESGEELDSYTASIELSNACREFYQSRVNSAEKARKKLNLPKRADDTIAEKSEKKCIRRTSIDDKMEMLRKEMSSLIDQDLALMSQLLTLNEAIEDLKWQRRFCSRSTLDSSTCLSVSCSCDQFYGSDSDYVQDELSISSPASLALLRSTSRSGNLYYKNSTEHCSIHSSRTLASNSYHGNIKRNDSTSHSADMRNSTKINDIELTLKDNGNRGCHGEQSSLDSGIHEPDDPDEILV